MRDVEHTKYAIMRQAETKGREAPRLELRSTHSSIDEAKAIASELVESATKIYIFELKFEVYKTVEFKSPKPTRGGQ